MCSFPHKAPLWCKTYSLCLNFSCIFSWVSSFPLVAECPGISKELSCCTQQGAWQQASGLDRACVSLQVEGENDEQPSTDQASAVKTKNVFIAQNVASLQELGRSVSTVRKLIYTLTQTSCLCFFHVEENQAPDRGPLDSVPFCQSRWLREAAPSVPEPAVFPALHQSVPGCSGSQFLLHHACDSS